MLRKINEGGVVSSSNFSIQITGPEELEYRDNNKVAKIDLIYDSRKRKIYVYASDVNKWELQGDYILVSEAERQEIISNLKEAVKLLKGDFEVL